VKTYWCVLRRVAGWVAGGWDDDITSDDWDHSRKFPAFSTKKTRVQPVSFFFHHPLWEFCGPKK
jgi:hypothetical protein